MKIAEAFKYYQEIIKGEVWITENKRFRISQGYTDRFCHDWQNTQLLNFRETVELLNELNDENEQLKIENNELKCALALNEVDFVIVDGKKIDIPAYYEFEQRYDTVIHRREYDGYD